MDKQFEWDGSEKCPACGGLMSVTYENNGFTMPEGPEHYEVTGAHCTECDFVAYPQ